MPNIVYIGTSLDGYIADSNDDLDWLDTVPIPAGDDLGFAEFMERIDALVMGRVSFETVLGFDIDWPYTRPVFVLSSTLTSVPEDLAGKVFLLNGSVADVVNTIHEQGFDNLYIDGGKTIQSFLQEDMIDELIVSRIPLLLGGGTPLFGTLNAHLAFEHVSTRVYLDAIVKSHYRRKR